MLLSSSLLLLVVGSSKRRRRTESWEGEDREGNNEMGRPKTGRPTGMPSRRYFRCRPFFRRGNRARRPFLGSYCFSAAQRRCCPSFWRETSARIGFGACGNVTMLRDMRRLRLCVLFHTLRCLVALRAAPLRLFGVLFPRFSDLLQPFWGPFRRVSVPKRDVLRMPSAVSQTRQETSVTLPISQQQQQQR